MRTIALPFYLICCLSVCTFLPVDLSAQSNTLQKRLDRLRHQLPQIMDSAQVPGLSLAIWEGDYQWQQSFGVKNVENETLVNTETVFEAASLSKPVFAYLVLKLAEKGRIDLDKPLVSYVPKETLERRFFNNPITDIHINLITARMVLTHSTGFPNWRQPQEAISLQFLPGSTFKYSGEGYMLLQLVIEHVMHRSLNKLARTYVFDPLGMANSSFRWENHFESHMAYGHNARGQVFDFRKPQQAKAAYSLLTTAADYGKFLHALLTADGLTESSFQDMFKSHMPTNYGQEEAFAWGLGLGLQQMKGEKVIWHWGDNNIYKCFMLGIPSQQFGFVYFSNSSTGLNIGEKISQLILGKRLPNFGYLGYDCYDAPELLLANTLRERGIVQGMRYYESLKMSTHTNRPELDEQRLMRLGYKLLAEGKVEEAIELFKVNVELHPDSWNAYDSLAEAYMHHGNDRLAIVNYERSLRINPRNANGLKMLKKLRE